MSQTSSRSGFTIVELVVAIALAGLIIGIAMPRTDAPGRRLAGALRETWATLSGARQQAVLMQHDVFVEFDTAAGLITVVQDADNDGVRDAGEVVSSQMLEGIAFGRGVASAGPIGNAAISFDVPPGAELPRVTFHRSGSASASGGFYLRTERATQAAWADEVRIVMLDRATARVSAFHPSGSRWERTF